MENLELIVAVYGDSILQNVCRTYCAYGTCTPTGFVGLGYIWMIGRNIMLFLCSTSL